MAKWSPMQEHTRKSTPPGPENRGCFAFDVSMVVVMPVVDVVVIRRLLRLVDDRRRCTVFGGAETRSLRLQPAER